MLFIQGSTVITDSPKSPKFSRRFAPKCSRAEGFPVRSLQDFRKKAPQNRQNFLGASRRIVIAGCPWSRMNTTTVNRIFVQGYTRLTAFDFSEADFRGKLKSQKSDETCFAEKIKKKSSRKKKVISYFGIRGSRKKKVISYFGIRGSRILGLSRKACAGGVYKN